MVDLHRYAGVWYEVARYPHRFQEGCYGSRATYTLRDDGRVGVLNECRQGGPDGPLRTADGVAKVVDPVTNAKLKVSFFWPFYGDYWVIDLGRDYEYAVVGHPSRQYLWILSRTPDLPAETYEAILARLRSVGYDTQRLIRADSPGR
jgi:apolipoprotein D and lipocalin family protein